MFKKGDKVVKVIRGAGCETASIQTISKVSKAKGLCWTECDDLSSESVCCYRLSDGSAVNNYIPGFSSRLIVLES